MARFLLLNVLLLASTMFAGIQVLRTPSWQIDGARQALKDTRESVRLEALDWYIKQGLIRELGRYQPDLEAKDPRIRELAIRYLSKTEPEKLRDHFLDLMMDPEPNVVMALLSRAIKVPEMVPDEADKILLELLRKPVGSNADEVTVELSVKAMRLLFRMGWVHDIDYADVVYLLSFDLEADREIALTLLLYRDNEGKILKPEFVKGVRRYPSYWGTPLLIDESLVQGLDDPALLELMESPSPSRGELPSPFFDLGVLALRMRLGLLSRTEFWQNFQPYLKHADPEVQRAALRTLGLVNPDTTWELSIYEASKSPVTDVVEAAHNAYSHNPHLAETRISALLAAPRLPTNRQWLVRVISQSPLTPEMDEFVARLTNHPDLNWRIAALHYFAQKGRAGIPKMLKTFNEADGRKDARLLREALQEVLLEVGPLEMEDASLLNRRLFVGENDQPRSIFFAYLLSAGNSEIRDELLAQPRPTSESDVLNEDPFSEWLTYVYLVLFGLILIGLTYGTFRINYRKQVEYGEAYKSEVEKAAEMINYFLPSSYSHDFLEIGIVHHPSKNAGGDFFRFLPREQALGFYLIDVQGHGLNAGILGHLLHATFTSAKLGQGSPSETLIRADALANELDQRVNKRFTMNFTEVDPVEGRLRHANAGIPFPVIVPRHDPSNSRSIKAGGPYIGESPSTREEVEEKVEPGDVLAFFSDGILEAGGLERDMFGRSRIIDLLVEYRELSAQELAEKLVKEARTHENHPKDDQTAVVIRVLNIQHSTNGGVLKYQLLNRALGVLLRLEEDVRAWAKNHGLSNKRSRLLWLALWEALQNACYHGSSTGDVLWLKLEPATFRGKISIALEQPNAWNIEDRFSSKRLESNDRKDRRKGTYIMLQHCDRIDVENEGREIIMYFGVDNGDLRNSRGQYE